MRALLLAGLCLLALLAVAPAPTAANPVCSGPFEPTIAHNAWVYACGAIDCMEAGLPNILVTCL